MRTQMLSLAVAVVLLAACAGAEETEPIPAEALEKYSETFDNINVDAILDSERLFKSYIDCFLRDTDDGCSPDAAFFKERLVEIFKTDCARCTEKQKEIVRKVVVRIQKKKPERYEELEQKFDPDRTYEKLHPEWFAPEVSTEASQ